MEQASEGFPDVRWGRSDTRIARVGQWLVSTPVGSFFVRTIVPLDRWVLTKSDGRFTALGPFGTPLLVLETTGARTGVARTTPLVYLPDEERILVVGSNFGRGSHPAWSTNLLKTPNAHVTIAGVRYPVTATLLGGGERAEGWAMFEAAARPYRAYESRTTREIRVFALRHDEQRSS